MSRVPLPPIVSEQRIIPVARGHDPDEMTVVAEALRAAGLGILEITLDSPGALDSIADLNNVDRLVGAGTVTTADAAIDAIGAGAGFIVSPHFDDRIVATAAGRGVPVVAGALTPTEIVAAWEAGASAVKLFPASLGGPGYIESVRGPLAGIPLIPTGGIRVDNARNYLEAGALAVGLGGWLTGTVDYELVYSRASRLREVCA